MSILELKDSVKALPVTQRGELISFLVHLEQTESGDFLADITRKIDETERHQDWSEIKDQLGDLD